MRVLVTGATGFVGRALVPVLQREGCTVVAWTRSGTRARSLLGAEVGTLPASAPVRELARAVERIDAVVNLAGAPLIGPRWTASRRRVLETSRVGPTDHLIHAIALAGRRPRVLVSASAVGYYGDRGAETLREDSPQGSGFLADLCARWEAAARGAEALGLRAAWMRTGIVLGRDGGALARMLPPFRIGAGGRLGSGHQYMPWIHLHDLAAILAHALRDERARGPINAVAPEAVTNRTFTRALARALGRPALVPVPSLALRALFGEAATVLLSSQRVEPAALTAAGFRFTFPSLDAALADLTSGAPVSIEPLRRPLDPGDDASRRDLRARPAYELRTSTHLDAPLDRAFGFFSQAGNLGALTPASMRFAIEGPEPALAEGATIRYRLRVGAVPVRWRTVITGWEPGRRFVDVQAAGPYRMWWHEHSFRADGNGTVMDDRVCYTPPLGWLGRLAHRLFIAPTLRRIFQYRADVIRLRFGPPAHGRSDSPGSGTGH